MSGWRTGVIAMLAVLALPMDAAACTLRQFRVYFPSGESAFPATDHAREEIRLFHRYVASAADPSIVIVGHTDRVGTPEEQVERSRLAALAVAAELEAAGLPRSIMAIRWKGAQELARPTADGEAEPLNRRVELFSTAPVDHDSACLRPLPSPGTPNE